MLENQEFVEAKMFSNNIYGTSIAEIQVAHDDNKVALSDLEVQGVAEYMSISSTVRPIFLLPPNYEVWQDRLKQRYHDNEIDPTDMSRSEENCVGCWMCAMVCPYGVIGRHTEVRMAVKCDRCKSLDVPACVAACPSGALIYATQREFVEMMRKEAAARIAHEARGLARA